MDRIRVIDVLQRDEISYYLDIIRHLYERNMRMITRHPHAEITHPNEDIEHVNLSAFG